MIDPRLNCAAEICCGPPPEGKAEGPAHEARVSILKDLGVPEDLADAVAEKMVQAGIVFLSAELAAAIRNIAFPAE